MQVMEWPPRSRRAEMQSQAQVWSLRSTRSTAVPAVAPRAASKGLCQPAAGTVGTGARAERHAAWGPSRLPSWGL